MSENVQTFSGKVNVADNLLVGTSHFFVDRQNNRVGIGTSTPDASSMLDVTGNIKSGGTITATGGFSGNGSGLSGVNSDSGSWVNGSSSNIHLAVSTDKVGIGTVSPAAELHVAGTGAIIVPTGSTGDRPTTGVNGMIRYNSTIGNIEVYTAGVWTPLTQPPTITGISPLTTLVSGGSSGAPGSHVAELVSGNPGHSHYFGGDVATTSDGSRAIVGAHGAVVSGISGAGDAHIFKNNGGTWSLEQSISHPYPAPTDNFGFCVDISDDGNYAFVGVEQDEPGTTGGYSANSSNHGSVQVYVRSGSSWSHQIELIETNPQPDDAFGSAVSCNSDGSRLLVGIKYDEVLGFGSGTYPGGAEIFVRNGTSWTSEGKLNEGTPGTNNNNFSYVTNFGYDGFGSTVSLSSDGMYAIIGAPSETANNHGGMAHIFVRAVTNVMTRSEALAVNASNGSLNANESMFYRVGSGPGGPPSTSNGIRYLDSGGSTEMLYHNKVPSSLASFPNATEVWVKKVDSNTYVAIGRKAPTGQTESWCYQQTLTKAWGNSNTSDSFGCSVDINADGTRAVVGIRNEDMDGHTARTDAGTVNIFVRNGTSWSAEQYINHPNPSASDNFGDTVRISADGTRILVAASSDDNTYTQEGSAHLFERNTSNNSWTHIKDFFHPNGGASFYFTGERSDGGIALSGDGNHVLVGVPREDIFAGAPLASQGTVQIFNMSPQENDVSTEIFTVTGTGITLGSTVKLVGADGVTLYDVFNATTPTGTQVTFKMGTLGTSGGFVVANQPYKVRIESASGLNVISTAQIGFSPTWTTAALTDFNFDAGVSGVQTIAGTDGGGGTNRTFSVQSGNLPANLGLNQNTGVIQGIPTTPGTTQVVFRLLDSNTSLFVDRTFNIVVNDPWEIIMRTSGKKNQYSSAMFTSFGNPGNVSFRSITASSTGASSRTSFGDAVGLYNAFFTKTGITKIALVSGDGNTSSIISHGQYIIYDLVESSGSESLHDIIKRLDQYNQNNASWAGQNFDNLYHASSVTNFTAGTNGYSGTRSGSSSGGILTEAGHTQVPDKFCIWGINQDSDNDTQVLCAYSGTLAVGNGKSDSWRGGQPKHSFWSYWGNDWHSNSQSQTIGSAGQSNPGIGDSVNTYTGDIYLMAF